MELTVFILFFAMCFHNACCLSHDDISHFSLDEINTIFGADGCIEGSVVTLQQPSGIPPTLLAHEEFIPEVMLRKVAGTIQRTSSRYDIHNVPKFINTGTTTTTTTKTESMYGKTVASDINGKSPMSVVNELSNLMKIRQEYRLIDVQGPSNERRFTVNLKLGDEEFTAEGPSIKKAQHFAASRFLHHTKYQQFLQQMSHKTKVQKSTGNAVIKSPTSVVYEIAAKDKLQLRFEVESKRGPPHMPTFVTKCTMGSRISRGQGSSKKLSKRAAAENMLEQLKNHVPSFLGSSSVRKRHSYRKKRKTHSLVRTFQQIIAGMQSDQTMAADSSPEFFLMAGNSTSHGKGLSEQMCTFVKDLLKSGSQLIGNTMSESSFGYKNLHSTTSESQPSQNQWHRAKDALMHVANSLDLKIEYTDLPKGQNSEFMSLVSLSEVHPTLCLGTGSSVEESHDQAAQRALKALSKLGLNLVSSPSDFAEESSWQDWLLQTQQLIEKAQDVFLMK